MGKYEEVLEEGRGPRVSPKVQGVHGSQGPRYLKLTFKYELDSKEGPSCYNYTYKAPFAIGLLNFLIFGGQRLPQNMFRGL